MDDLSIPGPFSHVIRPSYGILLHIPSSQKSDMVIHRVAYIVSANSPLNGTDSPTPLPYYHMLQAKLNEVATLKRLIQGVKVI